MSLASIITTAACLLLISAVFMLGLNIEANMAEFQVDNTMLAFVDDSYTDAQARALQSQIENVDHVVKVSYITREEAMADYIDQYEDGDATNSRLQASIFRNRYAIEMDNQEAVHEVAEAVSGIKGIADTRIDEVVSQGFAVVQKVVTIVGIMMTVLMLTICVVIMTNTIKLHELLLSYSRKYNNPLVRFHLHTLSMLLRYEPKSDFVPSTFYNSCVKRALKEINEHTSIQVQAVPVYPLKSKAYTDVRFYIDARWDTLEEKQKCLEREDRIRNGPACSEKTIITAADKEIEQLLQTGEGELCPEDIRSNKPNYLQLR